MEIEQKSNSPEKNSPAEEQLAGLGELFRADLPVGYFIINAGRTLALLNPYLRELLELGNDSSHPLAYEKFLSSLASRSDKPDQARIDLTRNLARINEHPSWQVSLRNAPGRLFELSLFPLPGGGASGGMLLAIPSEGEWIKPRMVILEELLKQARKLSAASVGNLAALADNLKTWNSALVAEFIQDAGVQLQEINQKLDLVLNFINIISGQAVFPEVLDLGVFLHNALQGCAILDLRPGESDGEAAPSLPVQLDPVLSGLAFEYLLDEITRHAPADQPADIILDSGEGFARVSIQSGRNLPLPGLSGSELSLTGLVADPKLELAVLIITSQGGSVDLEQLPEERGTGLRALVRLPLAAGSKPGSGAKGKLLAERHDPGRILLVETQAEYQLVIQEALKDQGYRVDLAVAGNAALDIVQRINPDGVILARDLPGMDGLLLTRGIRRWSSVPILMLSSRIGPDDLVLAYQSGVDDYLQKPFLMDELLLRLRAVLRRSSQSQQAVAADIYQAGDIRIDFSTRQVWSKGAPVHLTPIEYNLLVYMARQGKQIMTYDQLLDRVWEGPEKGTRQGLFVHVKRLRQKLESDPKNPRLIRNKWGVGYEFNP